MAAGVCSNRGFLVPPSLAVAADSSDLGLGMAGGPSQRLVMGSRQRARRQGASPRGKVPVEEDTAVVGVESQEPGTKRALGQRRPSMGGSLWTSLKPRWNNSPATSAYQPAASTLDAWATAAGPPPRAPSPARSASGQRQRIRVCHGPCLLKRQRRDGSRRRGKANPGGGAKGGGRKRKFLPHGKPVRKGGYPLRPGVQGFFITCDGGRERQATREALSLLDSFYEDLVMRKRSQWKPEGIPDSHEQKDKFADSDSSDDDDDDISEEKLTMNGNDGERRNCSS
ncbi:hypothetical protein HU200_047052 [Digitaria exilis]|uniref:Uncharacterized protein n=1 Tax=Digitaria exilis TaxID=1010633 RepID=A0A835AXM9_9POAL|nr:hypothetical protein HU200_047052 [Digitaria exilis]